MTAMFAITCTLIGATIFASPLLAQPSVTPKDQHSLAEKQSGVWAKAGSRQITPRKSGTDDDSVRPMPKRRLSRPGTDDDSVRPLPGHYKFPRQ